VFVKQADIEAERYYAEQERVKQEAEARAAAKYSQPKFGKAHSYQEGGPQQRHYGKGGNRDNQDHGATGGGGEEYA
jgi:hypothetical protein